MKSLILIPSLKLRRLCARVMALYLLLLASAQTFAQTRQEATEIIIQITNAVKNEGGFSADCSVFNHKFELFDGNHYQVEKVGNAENTYTNIPWKDLAFVNIDDNLSFYEWDNVSIFFNAPVTFKMEKDYFAKGHNDKTIFRKLRCIPMRIQKKQFAAFVKACRLLKALDAPAPPSPKVLLPAITQLPQITFCESVKAPTKDFVEDVFYNAAYYDKTKITGAPFQYLFEQRLLEAAGVTINPNTPSADMKPHYLKVKEYWDNYCYSFSYNKQTGALGSVFGCTLLEEGFYSMNEEVLQFVGYRCGGNRNFLSPLSGRSYMDNVYTKYSKKAHVVWTSDGEHDSQSDIEDMEYEIKQQQLAGARHSSTMIERYKYDAVEHDKLILAIICNSKGDGVFANLVNNPEKYFLLLYTIGLRNVNEAVLLYETIYNKKLPLAFVKAQTNIF